MPGVIGVVKFGFGDDLAAARAMDEPAVPRIDAGMPAGTAVCALEDHYVSRLQLALIIHLDAGPQLLPRPSGQGDAYLLIGPVNQAGTVKTGPRRFTAVFVADAYIQARRFDDIQLFFLDRPGIRNRKLVRPLGCAAGAQRKPPRPR